MSGPCIFANQRLVAALVLKSSALSNLASRNPNSRGPLLCRSLGQSPCYQSAWSALDNWPAIVGEDADRRRGIQALQGEPFQKSLFVDQPLCLEARLHQVHSHRITAKDLKLLEPQCFGLGLLARRDVQHHLVNFFPHLHYPSLA